MSKATKKTIGELTDELRSIYLEREAARKEVERLEGKSKEAELRLMEAADDQKTLSGKGTIGAFSLGEAVVPVVSDWPKFLDYIYKKKYGHLLERRASVTGCRELWDTKGPIPGVDKFTKRKINLRGV